MFRITTFHSLNEFFTLLPALSIKPNWIQWTLSTAFTLKNTPSLGRHAHSPTARCLDNQRTHTECQFIHIASSLCLIKLG